MSCEKDLAFIDNNPGTAKFGNFINYYSFHSTKERIDNLHPKMFQPIENDQIYCLDIGCNSGELTKELYVYLQSVYPNTEIKILAIDIDPVFIERAQEQNLCKNIYFKTSDIATESGCGIVKEFINNERRETYDIIFCFSVTMWIHINNGDVELEKLLTFLKDNSKMIIIEPQPWRCYKNAQRRMKRSGKCFELFDSLKIRDNVDRVIENILNHTTHIKVYESSSSSWNRRIQCYHKKI